MNKREEIRNFLNQANRLLKNDDYDFVPRRKNLMDLAAVGLSVLDAKEEISSLKLSDYHKGPKRDFDSSRPGEIWEFKKRIKNKRFYIKLKITTQGNRTILKCLSFHLDE